MQSTVHDQSALISLFPGLFSSNVCQNIARSNSPSWRRHRNGMYMYLHVLSNNKVPNADTLDFMHLQIVANYFYASKFTARYGDGGSTLLFEGD